MTSPRIHSPSEAIRTERLLLRPLSPTDSDGVFAIRSDPRVLYWTEPDTRKKSDEWMNLRLESKKTMTYTVSLLPSQSSSPTRYPDPSKKQDLQIIGLTGAHSLPEIGYIFHPSSWGHGFATEALGAWIERYWQKYPEGHPVLDGEEKGYLKAVTGPGGEGSRAVLRKCGFKWWGEEEVVDERLGAKERNMRVVLQEFRLQKPKFQTRPDIRIVI